MEYKNIIKELRLRQGYTQVDLAELSSLSLRTIQRIENNEVEPTPYSLNQIGEVLGVNLNELKNNIMKQKSKSSNSWNILLHLSSIFGIITTSIIWVIFKRKDEMIIISTKDFFQKSLALFFFFINEVIIIHFLPSLRPKAHPV